jgi:hypothetical protein
MMRAPFRRTRLFAVFDYNLDFPQHLFADLADRCAQGRYRIRRVPIENFHEIFMPDSSLRR